MQTHSEFWIDVGGTFTDCVRQLPDGSLDTCKVLSSGVVKASLTDGRLGTIWKALPNDFWAGYQIRHVGQPTCETRIISFDNRSGEITTVDAFPVNGAVELTAAEPAPVLAIRIMLGKRLEEVLGRLTIRLGTTRGTNALLERKGAKVGLLTNAGLEDTVLIGNQARPDLFDLRVRTPSPLVMAQAGISARLDADGNVLAELDEKEVRKQVRRLLAEGATSLAVALLHSYANPDHEQQIRQLIESENDLGCNHLAISSELSPTIKLLDRTDTAVVDAYLGPIVRDYVQIIKACAPEADLHLMTSAGGLVKADRFQAKDSILSGPAGGVTAFSHLAREAGFSKSIGFDMGGTSTDVSRFDGTFDYQFAAEKAGVRLVAPMFAIETVAAGGGSVCHFDGQRLLVGPESAGADPGPACYGKGGPLTVTDINAYCGRLDSSAFPFALDMAAVEKQMQACAATIAAKSGIAYTLDELADGFTTLANRKMADAIRLVSTAKGYDLADYVMVCFGGAGGQHATAIAEDLGIDKILIHPLAGILSAYGMGVADAVRFREVTILQPLSEATLRDQHPLIARFVEEMRLDLSAEGFTPNQLSEPNLMLDLRYAGEESTITISEPQDGDFAQTFALQHEQLYGYCHKDRTIEVVNLRVEQKGMMPKPAPTVQTVTASRPEPSTWKMVRTRSATLRTAVFRRPDLTAGASISGPAMVTDPYSTTIIDAGWQGTVTRTGNLLLNRQEVRQQAQCVSTDRDPLRLELFHQRLTQIATQMGITLQRTALSVNVKERLDFSCAIMDADGRLVVNAPHIPVHLGAMGECVRSLLASRPDMQPGDSFLCNDPAQGGSHLPDLTVMTPVFDAAGAELQFVVASRAHHAEIGGLRPGSMYPFAKNLAEEGVIFRHEPMVKAGVFLEAEIRQKLAEAAWPSRDPDSNLADLRGQLAANQLGVRALHQLVQEQSWPVVAAYMGHIRETAEAYCRNAISQLQEGTHGFSDLLDDGTPLKLTATIKAGHLKLDFSGTGAVRSDSLNANRAIVQSAVLYALRCLISQPVPLNDGVLEAVDLHLPQCLLSPPVKESAHEAAAVVGGNVELSQKVVDLIFGTLGTCAASQGTMNNLVFGNASYGFYETIGGGTGAGPDWDGTAAIHSHMTNTRLTDVEIMEKRYPVRVRTFAIRHGSGGGGTHQGGDGMIREIEFLEETDVCLLTQRRLTQPYGLAGGASGKSGCNLLIKPGVSPEKLPSLAVIKASPGDCLRIETPGGGGYGQKLFPSTISDSKKSVTDI